MLRSKKVLFAGIILLVIGILIRRLTEFELAGLSLLLFGVLLKTLYIVAKARSGEYRPGRELFLLFIGLGLFFGGLYLKSQQPGYTAIALMITGISLKVLFIIMFIKNVKSLEKVSNQ